MTNTSPFFVHKLLLPERRSTAVMISHKKAPKSQNELSNNICDLCAFLWLALREAVSDDVFGWRAFEDWLSVRFEPGVAVDLTVVLVSHTEYDPRRDAVA